MDGKRKDASSLAPPECPKKALKHELRMKRLRSRRNEEFGRRDGLFLLKNGQQTMF
jgi:hypothetical protein